ncbi:MAG: DUF2330 domain-containing protein [Planctomycetota bacterium]
MNRNSYPGLSAGIAALTIAAMLVSSFVAADPCGMVPPIYSGESPIARAGVQQTYVFHHDGVESFAIRPGYEGNIDNFGMLIPFPTPPSIRKVHDNVFAHIKNAIDPPEVVVDLSPPVIAFGMPAGGIGGGGGGLQLARADEGSVTVLREEAVGMYEVAVLEAGSADALKKWMDENGYQFPEGMDAVANEYIAESWCFVAVKTKVSARDAIEPRPGQRGVAPGMPADSSFDGHVQGLAFRFRTEELVVPMRLSAFNEGDTRNVVYLLTDGARRIRNIPEEYVMRQISGRQLVNNITQPLPLRVIGGTIEDVPEDRMEALVEERRPEPENGIAAQLFISDILASRLDDGDELLLDLETSEKSLALVNERLQLRGEGVDDLIVQAMSGRFERDADALNDLRSMTLTVVDGEFPREVLAGQNLRFDAFSMAPQLNTPLNYDANIYGPQPERPGQVYLGAVDRSLDEQRVTVHSTASVKQTDVGSLALPGILLMSAVCVFGFRRRNDRHKHNH